LWISGEQGFSRRVRSEVGWKTRKTTSWIHSVVDAECCIVGVPIIITILAAPATVLLNYISNKTWKHVCDRAFYAFAIYCEYTHTSTYVVVAATRLELVPLTTGPVEACIVMDEAVKR
jgi:hypothetical protein